MTFSVTTKSTTKTLRVTIESNRPDCFIATPAVAVVKNYKQLAVGVIWLKFSRAIVFDWYNTLTETAK